MKRLKVAVIGSGIAGLAVAIRLALKYHEVHVFEANSYPGGKLSEMWCGAYRFDKGPSLLTLPGLIDELFLLAGETPENFFSYERLPVNCHYFYPDGTRLLAYADRDAFMEEALSKTCEKRENLEKVLLKSEELYQTLSPVFIERSLQDPQTFWSRAAFSAYKKMHRLGFFRSMNGANSEALFDPKMVQLFNRYATYNGSSPYWTPATMNIIPHLEMGFGAFFPKGGMHAISRSLFDLAKRCGAVFHLNTPVERILRNGRNVRGVRVAGESVPFDRVISNVDMVSTYRKLMPDLMAPELLLRQPKSSSALIFYWGIRQSFSELGLHNIFFSGDYRREFDGILQKAPVSEDPTVYINITSKLESEDAPPGHENWFTMINVPNNQGQDWDELIARIRKNVLDKLSSSLQEPIEALIAAEAILDPRSIESQTGSAQGALYGNSSNSLFSAFLRHSNVSRRVQGLYFCGGSVHPGGGIPMCLSSAKLVADYFQ